MKLRTEDTPRRRSRAALLAAVVLLVGLAAGCRQDMHNQPKLRPLRESTFFDNQSSARPLPENTVARGDLYSEVQLAAGLGTGRAPSGDWVQELPLSVDLEFLERGQQRYNIFCSPCHDRTGSGLGMIVLRGFVPPPTYHSDRLRGMPVGYFYDVISNGFGAMNGYKAQIHRDDRWAIAAWIRVLQLSQATPAADLSADDLRRVEVGERVHHEAPGSGGHGEQGQESQSDGSHAD